MVQYSATTATKHLSSCHVTAFASLAQVSGSRLQIQSSGNERLFFISGRRKRKEFLDHQLQRARQLRLSVGPGRVAHLPVQRGPQHEVRRSQLQDGVRAQTWRL